MKVTKKLKFTIIFSIIIIEVITAIILVEYVYNKDDVIVLSFVSYIFITTSILGLVEKRNYFTGRFAKKSEQIEGRYYGKDNDINQVFNIMINIFFMFFGLLAYYLNFLLAFNI